MVTRMLSKVFIRALSTEKTVNRVTLLGRVGTNAEMKGTVEHPVVIFNMATSSGPKTEWHRISVFKPGLRQVAESYVKTGSRLLVEGKLTYGHVIDSNGGAMPITSIIADEIIFLSRSGAKSDVKDETEEEKMEQ